MGFHRTRKGKAGPGFPFNGVAAVLTVESIGVLTDLLTRATAHAVPNQSKFAWDPAELTLVFFMQNEWQSGDATTCRQIRQMPHQTKWMAGIISC